MEPSCLWPSSVFPSGRDSVNQEVHGQAHMATPKAHLILCAWVVMLVVLSMHTEDADHGKVGPVRKVASEPQGLHALKGDETTGMHRSEVKGDSIKPGAALALPPSVYAAMHTIEEAHTEQCEGMHGDALPGPDLESTSDGQGWPCKLFVKSDRADKSPICQAPEVRMKTGSEYQGRPCGLLCAETLMSGSPQETNVHAGEAKSLDGACPIKSPFTAVNGVEGMDGLKEEAHHAEPFSHDASQSEGTLLC